MALIGLFVALLAPLAVGAGPAAPAGAATAACPSTYTYGYTRYAGDIWVKVYYLPGSTSQWRYCAVAIADRAVSRFKIQMYAINSTTKDWEFPDANWTHGEMWKYESSSVGPVYWDYHGSGYCLWVDATALDAAGHVIDDLTTSPHCNP